MNISKNHSEYKSPILLLIVCFVAVFVIFLYILVLKNEHQKNSDERPYIEKLFEKYQPKEAYEIFKKKHEKDDQWKAHIATHAFGEILYKKEGMAGLKICDDAFGFACFHTLTYLMISDYGVDIVKKLDNLCVETYGLRGLGCFHGLGHGILSYYGYSNDGIKKALSICDTLSWKGSYGGCRDGVFMENNLRILEVDPQKRNRPFSVEERHEPCDSVPSSSRVACYFDQSQWWSFNFLNNPDLLVKVSSFCNEVKNNEERKSCFRGIGYSRAQNTLFNQNESGKFCDKITSPDDGSLWCREGFAWAMYVYPKFRPNAEKACEIGASEIISSKCKKEFRFLME